MTITYEVYDNLYLNITNKCHNACTFCIRNDNESISNNDSLWLEHEPSVDEIKADIDKRDLSKYKEIVFCGFGEPTERFFDMLEIAKYIKSKPDIKIRLNTNGQANLLMGKDVTPLIKNLIDSVSVSLNGKNAKEYNDVCRSSFGEEAFNAMLSFVIEAKKYVNTVVLTVVDTMLAEDIEACRKIAAQLGVEFRVRELI